VHVAERSTAGADLGVLALGRSNAGKSVSYSLVSQDPVAGGTGGCLNKKPFVVAASTGRFSVVFGSTMLDFETCAGYDVELKLEDADGSSRTCSLKVLLDDRNDPPTIESLPVREIEEGAAVNDPVGAKITGSDVDRGQELLWSIESGNSDGFFKISRCSGLVSVLAEGLDYETINKYTLLIRATDDGSP